MARIALEGVTKIFGGDVIAALAARRPCPL
jgi:hypothetical protein